MSINDDTLHAQLNTKNLRSAAPAASPERIGVSAAKTDERTANNNRIILSVPLKRLHGDSQFAIFHRSHILRLSEIDTAMLSNSFYPKPGGYHENDRYCTQKRRFWGSPLTGNIDTESDVLSGAGSGVGTVHQTIKPRSTHAGSFSTLTACIDLITVLCVSASLPFSALRRRVCSGMRNARSSPARGAAHPSVRCSRQRQNCRSPPCCQE